MVTYLLKKSYQRKTLKETNFQDLWGAEGVFTTMMIFGKPAKILFFKKHIENLIKSAKHYRLNKPKLKNDILNLGVFLCLKDTEIIFLLIATLSR